MKLRMHIFRTVSYAIFQSAIRNDSVPMLSQSVKQAALKSLYLCSKCWSFVLCHGFVFCPLFWPF